MVGIVLLFLSAQLAFATKVEEVQKRFNRFHSFPELTPQGKQSANEFQFVFPENIQRQNPSNLRADASYSLTEISPLKINARDMVTVSYKAAVPSTKDWIGAYSPANVDITTTVPVKYGWCDDDKNYLSTGLGALTFNFTNLRADIAFYYFTNSTGYPIVVATATDKIVSFNNNNEPGKPRVVATGDYDVFHLLWSSATSKTPTLRWGTKKGGPYNHIVGASTKTIPKESLCGAPATTIGWRDLGLIHTAPLRGMKALANKDLYYIFGDDRTNDYSREYYFHVPPLPGTQPPNRPTRIILYDDLGRGSNDMTYTWYEYGRPSYDTMNAVGYEVAQGMVDVVWHGGDISYATGYLAVWDFFFEMLSNVASGALYLSTVGNHESDWYNSASFFNNSDCGGECGKVATQMLPLPAPAVTDKPWYSYDTGIVHYIGVSTEHDIQIGSEQYLWLEKDLASVDRSVTPWVIFSAHRAMYINSNYGGNGNPSTDVDYMWLFVKNVEPLLFKYKVNLGFYGHNHAVQRHSAVYNYTTIQKAVDITDPVTGEVIHYHDDPQATVHWIIGTAGATFTKNSVTPGPDWNEETFYVYGYARMTAVNATYLDWEWVESTTGKVLSHMVMTQADPYAPFKI